MANGGGDSRVSDGLISGIALLKGLKSDKVTAKEVDILEYRTVVEGVPGLSTSNARTARVKGSGVAARDCVNIAVAKACEMFHAIRDLDVKRVAVIEHYGVDLLGFSGRT